MYGCGLKLTMEIEYVASERKKGRTYAEISTQLQQMFPLRKGLSERSVRFCKLHGLTKMDEEVDEVVEQTVEEIEN